MDLVAAPKWLEEFELAKQAMDRAKGNLTQAAKLLDISRDQLRYKLKKAGEYNLPETDQKV